MQDFTSRTRGLLPGVLLLATALVLTALDIDRLLAQAWFFRDGGWIGVTGDWWARGILHSGGRWVVRVVALVALLVWVLPLRTPAAAWRREAGVVFRGMVVATLVVGLLKQWTNVDCPWDLAQFGGDRPYLSLFEARPAHLPHAACFPGAHSSSGFALLALFFALRERAPRAARRAALAGWLAGAAFALGQEARGAHFLSHDLASAGIVWCVLVLLGGGTTSQVPSRQEVQPRQRIRAHAHRQAPDDVA